MRGTSSACNGMMAMRISRLKISRWNWRKIRRACQRPFEWLGIGIGWLVLTNLPHGMLMHLCDFLSSVMYVFDHRGRCRSLENLRIAFGTCTGTEGTRAFDPDSAAYNPTRKECLIIRRAYRNMARTIGHIFWTCRKARERVASVGEMSEEGRAFLRQNRPAVTVSAHVGCWEILSQLAYLEGHSMMSVAKKIGTNGMTRMLMKARKSIGQEIVAADGAFRPLMKGIKEGKSLGLLVDQSVHPEKGGLWIRFFGKPLPVSAAPAFFAAKAKVPIAVAWSRPLKNGHYRCEVVDVIAPDEARDIWATTQRCARDLERIIRRHPSCWVLNYNLYSDVPTEEDLHQLESREKGLN